MKTYTQDEWEDRIRYLVENKFISGDPISIAEKRFQEQQASHNKTAVKRPAVKPVEVEQPKVEVFTVQDTNQ